jgi:ferrochelatase
MALAKALDVSEERMTVCFQSRLGRIPWIQPYTDETVVKLAKSGKKRIAVFSPSFVADCLETLEEIGIRAKESFIKNGGLELTLVPSLNGDPVWTKAIGDHLEKRLS